MSKGHIRINCAFGPWTSWQKDRKPTRKKAFLLPDKHDKGGTLSYTLSHKWSGCSPLHTSNSLSRNQRYIALCKMLQNAAICFQATLQKRCCHLCSVSKAFSWAFGNARTAAWHVRGKSTGTHCAATASSHSDHLWPGNADALIYLFVSLSLHVNPTRNSSRNHGAPMHLWLGIEPWICQSLKLVFLSSTASNFARPECQTVVSKRKWPREPALWRAKAIKLSMLGYTDAGSVCYMQEHHKFCCMHSLKVFLQTCGQTPWVSGLPAALQSLVKSLIFENWLELNLCDLAETFQRQEIVHLLMIWFCSDHKTWMSNSGLQKEMTTWARALKGKSYQAPLFCCWGTRMRDLCLTCKNINNFVACTVSRSFCRLVAKHLEFLGCGLLCAPKSCKESAVLRIPVTLQRPSRDRSWYTYCIELDSVRIMSWHIMQPSLIIGEHLVASEMLTENSDSRWVHLAMEMSSTQVKWVRCHIVNS